MLAQTLNNWQLRKCFNNRQRKSKLAYHLIQKGYEMKNKEEIMTITLEDFETIKANKSPNVLNPTSVTRTTHFTKKNTFLFDSWTSTNKQLQDIGNRHTFKNYKPCWRCFNRNERPRVMINCKTVKKILSKYNFDSAGHTGFNI